MHIKPQHFSLFGNSLTLIIFIKDNDTILLDSFLQSISYYFEDFLHFLTNYIIKTLAEFEIFSDLVHISL